MFCKFKKTFGTFYTLIIYFFSVFFTKSQGKMSGRTKFKKLTGQQASQFLGIKGRGDEADEDGILPDPEPTGTAANLKARQLEYREERLRQQQEKQKREQKEWEDYQKKKADLEARGIKPEKRTTRAECYAKEKANHVFMTSMYGPDHAEVERHMKKKPNFLRDQERRQRKNEREEAAMAKRKAKALEEARGMGMVVASDKDKTVDPAVAPVMPRPWDERLEDDQDHGTTAFQRPEGMSSEKWAEFDSKEMKSLPRPYQLALVAWGQVRLSDHINQNPVEEFSYRRMNKEARILHYAAEGAEAVAAAEDGETKLEVKKAEEPKKTLKQEFKEFHDGLARSATESGYNLGDKDEKRVEAAVENAFQKMPKLDKTTPALRQEVLVLKAMANRELTYPFCGVERAWNVYSGTLLKIVEGRKMLASLGQNLRLAYVSLLLMTLGHELIAAHCKCAPPDPASPVRRLA
jgi:hypothetical protein